MSATAPRIHIPEPLTPGAELALPARAVRHVQVLRMQPGQTLCLFPGADADSHSEYQATITAMGRSHVQVRIEGQTQRPRENALALHLAVGMPSNERMDWLIEKATELGVASILPVMTERSVLRLKGERADKKRAHWQGIAIAACEQCGRNRVPAIAAPATLAQLLRDPALPGERLLLSLAPDATPLAQWLAQQQLLPPAAAATTPPHSSGPRSLCVLSGPEGGLSPAEEQLARQHQFQPIGLGPRTLRADTAPLALAAVLACLGQGAATAAL
ncbi:16S rRNA (uracil(1498)-N(3))-methyltransferase [Vandammella animalimorsus]|uniref:Ribosomal RNA small subunit methyltransferase E n=1 Tax=Vandammella animalimorsus TaxID=2029117 RepID=A0A3M6RKF7_9BURK|nr:16S rRNA (uracil(1498)-N(3))-methyltransferase [Vandammella animalimorsus]RMX14852.1 16S rRNA (uracil(1498)-N(3))-methyltransferase [Vandammella animalimorsus]